MRWVRLHALLERRHVRALFKAGVIVIATVLITWYRRPDQFDHPYVWVEDCAINIKALFEQGRWFVFTPYQSYIGYYAFPSRLLFAAAATLSFRWLPELGAALAVAFQAFTLLAIAFSPTQLRYRTLCALAILLLPIASEVFGVSLYAGWWGSLLALLPLFWRDGPPQRRMVRLVLLLVGGFSSPLIIGLVPLYALRFFWKRERESLIDLLVAAGIAAAQVISLSAETKAFMPALQIAWVEVPLAIQSFFGFFLYWRTDQGNAVVLIAGLALVVFIAVSILSTRRRWGLPIVLLVACLGVEVAMTYIRQGSLASIHPILWGPRYFFFSFATLTWLLLQLAAIGPGWIRNASALFLIVMVLNFLRIPSSHHDAVDWRAHVSRCLVTEGYALPFHYDGRIASMGITNTSVAECRYLVGHSLFDNSLPPANPHP
ncbi:MAG TPA: hypothetical protein VF132_12420 [Rudaea sp.]